MERTFPSTTIQGQPFSTTTRILRLLAGTAVVCALAPLFLTSARTRMFSSDFLPHGFCLMWNPSLLALHVASDLLIWLAYLSIASMLSLLVWRLRDRLPFHWMILSFGLFIVACGFTHLMDVIVLWKPMYWLAGYLKLLTAAVSVVTAIALPTIFPKLRRLLEDADQSKINAARFLAASESSLDGFYILESVRDARGEVVDFRFAYLNENGAALTNYSREQLMGSHLCAVLPVNRDGEFFIACKRVVETGVPLDIEYPSHSGQLKAKWLCSKIVKLDEGVAVTASDITRRKETEFELQTSFDIVREAELRQRSLSGRLMLATEVAQVGIWEWNLAAGELTWDSTMAALYGVSEDQTTITHAKWIQAVHPADRPEVEAVLREVIDDGRPASVEFRIFRADGEIRFISSAQGVIRDRNSAVVGVIGVNMDITERKLSTARISHLAHHDSLTGLPNRELLQDRLRVCLDRSRRFKTRLGVLVIDLDSFKKTNDALGHRAGDEVLKLTAARLKAQFRSVDTVARIGGDEFVALLPDLSTLQDARRLGLKALEALNEPMSIGGQEVHISASIGIAFFPDGGLDPDLLLHNADTAMYFAKSAGKNNLQVFTAELDEATARKNRMEDALRQAIRNQEFQLVYQPQISLANDTVTGFEALIRWHSPTLGTVMPLDFIALAEETGLIVPIGEWVLRTACRDAIEIQQMLGRPSTMAVNLSPRQFQQEGLSEMIESILSESGLAPGLLEIEITENMLVSDTNDALAVLNRIRAVGVRLSIDDFGTGFSSMSYLIKFAVDRLKIDRSFISDAINDLSCRTVTKAIIGLAHDLKIDVVAEGVETEEQRTFLVRQGCNDAQGYLFSSPKTLAELPAALASIEAGASASKQTAHRASWPPDRPASDRETPLQLGSSLETI